ncbi:MAG: gamma-glutamyl-gamma-aminobutyrate hydrolase family protein [Alphaproteobacteria bacterium]|nr:gamma-glutamyl-gamma-aminobutyrate hydrolase family protein [Alphaproteobacteria bacterium]
MKSVIGITLDSEGAGGYATVPWYALRQNYCASVTDAGGVPLPLPHCIDAVDVYASRIDGLILTGGGFDIPPHLYGDDNIHPTVTLKVERTDFELAMARACFDQGKPIFGICGGMQLINVMLGGTLIQDIPSHKPEAIPHKQSAPYNKAFHPITIYKDSLLCKLNPEIKAMAVNSVHHQAVDRVGEGLRVSSIAPDGIVEGVEYKGDTFCVGVQWHPEYGIISLDTHLFKAFISACKSE